jgi:LysR family transcriptional regulator (chromosome initiation inhibitor)
MSTFDPDALECLAAIVEECGFERAAQRLRVLEAQVGTVLIVRSRPLKATAAGQLLLKHIKMLRLLRADLVRDLKELAPSSLRVARKEDRISIAINADSIATWALSALPALTELAQQGLAHGNRHRRPGLHPGMAAGRLCAVGCVTALKQALRGCKVVPLGAMDYMAVATPAFAQARLTGRSPGGAADRAQFSGPVLRGVQPQG